MKIKNLSIKVRLRLKKILIEVKRTHLRDLRNLTFSNLKKIPDIVHLKNLVLFSSVLSVVILAMFVTRFSRLNTYFIKETPDFGGAYSHGVVGNIEKINPLFVQDEAENVANKLVYSGLTRVTSTAEFTPDLAESWQVSDDGLNYTFKIKKDIKWHDGRTFGADDVLFTIGLIQNPDTRTSLSQIWRGVTIEKINEFEVLFKLPNPFPSFLNVASQPILPKHLLQEIDPKNIKAAQFNTDPVGTGPYKFVRFDQIGTQSGVIFESNDDFAIHRPYLAEIRLVLYDDNESMMRGIARRQIMGVVDVPSDKLNEIKQLENIILTQNYLPQYEVLNFNLKNEILANKDIRVALAAAVNRTQIISNALAGNAKQISAPILPGRSGYDPKAKGVSYDVAIANDSLEKLGWIRGEDGIRRKDGSILKFRLVFVDEPENNRVANLLKEQFMTIGVNLELLPENVNLINANYIRPRNFDMIMIGQNVGLNIDLYSFWHSTQVADPGQNLTGFSDKKVDKLLEQVRKSNDEKYRAERLRQVQEVLIAEQPAIFLYSPLHTSVISKEIHGSKQSRTSQSSDMLNNIYDWYTRVKKTR
jgi:peptide/nickel transport system substrate-binding protein